MLVIDGIMLFVATTAERFFRIDQAHEHLHYATDIFSEELFIVYVELRTDDEATISDVAVPPDHGWSHLDEDNPPTEKTMLLAEISEGFGHRPLQRVCAKRNAAISSKCGR